MTPVPNLLPATCLDFAYSVFVTLSIKVALLDLIGLIISTVQQHASSNFFGEIFEAYLVDGAHRNLR